MVVQMADKQTEIPSFQWSRVRSSGVRHATTICKLAIGPTDHPRRAVPAVPLSSPSLSCCFRSLSPSASLFLWCSPGGANNAGLESERQSEGRAGRRAREGWGWRGSIDRDPERSSITVQTKRPVQRLFRPSGVGHLLGREGKSALSGPFCWCSSVWRCSGRGDPGPSR